MFLHDDDRLSDGEPKYKRPCRLCIGENRDNGKPIFSEGLGEWKHVDVTYFNEDSDSDNDFSMSDATITHTRLFWWAWNWDELYAEELEMAEERDRCHDDALLHDQEEKEHLQYLIASYETFRSPSPEVKRQRTLSSCEASG